MVPSVKHQLQMLFANPVFLACVSSWFIAQFVKTVIKLVTGKINNLIDLCSFLFWRTGGMPSSHSSLMATLCVSIGFRSGFTSDIFILALCFYLIVIRDAVGVRRANGLQSRALNQLGKELSEKGSANFTPVREVQGHQPLEVLVGSFLGFFIGVAFATL